MDSTESKLWVGAGCAMGADIVTTLYGETHTSLSEANPIINVMSESLGLVAALIVIKLIAVVMGLLFREVTGWLGETEFRVIPLALLGVNGFVVVFNLCLILSTTFM